MSSINPQEIAQFAKDSSHWWDEEGPFKPLHKLNPVRIEYILGQIEAHFEDSAKSDLTLLDVGCGGGLVCEPLSRLGFQVTGVDADKNAIHVAQEHCYSQGLNVQYQSSAVEELEHQYDVVLALEIIEHVTDPQKFVRSVLRKVKPGGMAIFSTLNRTRKSYLLGVVAAERLLGWVPAGTHEWKKFVKPSELARFCRAENAEVQNISGLVYHPLQDQFSISKTDVSINYFMSVSFAD